MASAFTQTPKEPGTKVNGSMISNTEKVLRTGLKVPDTRVTTREDSSKALESTLTMMAQPTMESGPTTESMAMELKYGLTARSTTDSGWITI